MNLLEKILKENPGIEEDESRGDTLKSLLGETSGTASLVELAVKKIYKPAQIKEFYSKYIEFIADRYNLTIEQAKEIADLNLGYASASSEENQKKWLDTLEDISHPVFGRRIYKNTEKIITDLEVTLRNAILLERFEAYLRDLSPNFLIGEISYSTISDNPAKLKLSFSEHIAESEQHISMIVGIIEGIGRKMEKETGKTLEYTLRWSSKKLASTKKDIQSYWEEKLNYVRLGNSWFVRGLKQKPRKKEVWVEEAYRGQYPTSCTDGTPAPEGLHLRFSFDKEDLGKGTRMVTGWSFVGKQIQDFLEASKIKNPKKLIGKKFNIYEIGTRMVGIDAYKEERNKT